MMIERYLRLKKKGLTPTVALIDITGQPMPLGNETQAIELTMTLFDEDTGQAFRTETMREGLLAFIERGKEARKRWNAYKDIYELLTGLPWPTE